MIKKLRVLSILAAGWLAMDLLMFSEPRMIRVIPLLISLSALIVSAVLSTLDTDLKNKKQMKEILNTSKNKYDNALDHLAKHPNDPNARVQCVEKGRKYYELIMPDTQTVVTDQYGSRPIATQHNQAGREAAVQSDIEARVGHLGTK